MRDLWSHRRLTPSSRQDCGETACNPRATVGTFLRTFALLLALSAACGTPCGAQAAAPVPVIVIRPRVATAYALASVHGTGRAARATVDPVDLGAIARSAADARRVVLYVPGFNTRFTEGLAAAGRLQGAFGRDDLVVFVDWGSLGKVYDYKRDAARAHAAIAPLENVLLRLRGLIGSRDLDIFAHSMGTRIAAGAIASMPATPRGAPIGQVVLAAPDLAIADYARSVGRRPAPFGRVTVYASRRDRVLMLSMVVHLRRRLGTGWRTRDGLARTDVVDVSVASRGGGHGYAIHDAQIMHDIAETLAGAPPPHAAWKRDPHATGFWIFAR
jgi:esterase/lipase superfamily enzyme